MSARYNLRRRAGLDPAAVTTGDAIGEPPAHIDRTTDSLAWSSSLSNPSSPGRRSPGAERRTDMLYSDVVASRSPTPVRDTEGSETTVRSNSNNISIQNTLPEDAGEAASTTASNRKHPVTVEEVTDDEGGPWIEVQRHHRRALSASAIPTTRPRGPPPRPVEGVALSAQQRAAVAQAEERLTQAERERFARRMGQARSARRRAETDSTTSRGEGPSDPMRKGKAVDARNWGASGIPDDELDPAVQKVELDKYNMNKSLQAGTLAGYDTDEQRAILEYWRTRKETESTTGRPPSPSSTETSTDQVRKDPGDARYQDLLRRYDALQRDVDSLRATTAERTTAEPVRKKSVARSKKSRSSGRKPTDEIEDIERSARPAKGKQTRTRNEDSSLRPVTQLEPGSYLGRAFADLVGGGDPGDSSSSSSSSSPSSDSPGTGRST